MGLLPGLILASGSTRGAVLYVWQESPSPGPPYSNWASAAHVIQEAVDAARPADEIVVTNGLYATGGRTVGTNLLVNRVAVNKPVTVRSVNGPQFTIIQGCQVPGSTNGDGPIRCAYLADGAVLAGFTLTNGATLTSGDWSNRGRQGGGVRCEGLSAVVSNCVLKGNSAFWAGGGAYGGTLNNCVLTGNSAVWWGGGGAFGSILNNCTLTANSVGIEGAGGGACDCTLNNCTLVGNFPGAWDCTLNNCIVYYNTGRLFGDDLNYYACTFNHCCTTPLPTSGVGNITNAPLFLDYASGNLRLQSNSPCINAGNNSYLTDSDFINLFDLDGNPRLVGATVDIGAYEFPGSATGPLTVVIEASYTNVVVGYAVDLTGAIDGWLGSCVWDCGDGTTLSNQMNASHAWIAPGDYPVALRAYNDSNPGGVSATLAIHVATQPVHYVAAANPNPITPYTSWATAATNIQDAVDAADVASCPMGSEVLVLVTNGIYATGGRAVDGTMTNRVVLDKPITVRSVNGPQFTFIEGYRVPGAANGCGDGAVRCAYLGGSATLSGFALTNGATRSAGEPWHEQTGGGVWCASGTAIVTNCVLAGNSASDYGGGAAYVTLNNCTLTANFAGSCGGGAWACTLNNCTLFRNRATEGGGADVGTLNNCTLISNYAAQDGGGARDVDSMNSCTIAGNAAGNEGGGVWRGSLNNCIVYSNSAPRWPNYRLAVQYGTIVNYCCTTPLPTNGIGNTANAPLFVDFAGGNLRLQSNSPCINAGNNSCLSSYLYLTDSYFTNCFDLNGNPRIVNGTVDIGAYEYQGPGSTISYAWLQQYGLPTDGSVDLADRDGDGLNTWQEWLCQTCPTNALSALRLLPPLLADGDITLRWESIAGVNYFLDRCTNMAGIPCFTRLATGLAGETGVTTFTDTNAVGTGGRFYRIGVSR